MAQTTRVRAAPRRRAGAAGPSPGELLATHVAKTLVTAAHGLARCARALSQAKQRGDSGDAWAVLGLDAEVKRLSALLASSAQAVTAMAEEDAVAAGARQQNGEDQLQKPVATKRTQRRRLQRKKCRRLALSRAVAADVAAQAEQQRPAPRPPAASFERGPVQGPAAGNSMPPPRRFDPGGRGRSSVRVPPSSAARRSASSGWETASDAPSTDGVVAQAMQCT